MTNKTATDRARYLAELSEPIGWVYQHEDTGRMTFCENDGINTPEVFQRLNPRHTLCGPAYVTPRALLLRVSNKFREIIALTQKLAPDGCDDCYGAACIANSALAQLAESGAMAQPAGNGLTDSEREFLRQLEMHTQGDADGSMVVMDKAMACGIANALRRLAAAQVQDTPQAQAGGESGS